MNRLALISLHIQSFFRVITDRIANEKSSKRRNHGRGGDGGAAETQLSFKSRPDEDWNKCSAFYRFSKSHEVDGSVKTEQIFGM